MVLLNGIATTSQRRKAITYRNARRVQGQPTPAADADDADAIRVHAVKHGQEIHRRLEILRVDVGRGHIPGLAAAFACERWIKGEGQKSPLRHGLGVQAGALLLHRAEGPADGDGRQLTVSVLGDIHIRRQGDAIAIGERHLAVIHFVALGKVLSHSWVRFSASVFIIAFSFLFTY